MNYIYGFYAECVSKLGGTEGEALWKRANSLFEFLPLAAVARADGLFFIHGGIGDSITSLQQLKELQKPITVPQHVGEGFDAPAGSASAARLLCPAVLLLFLLLLGLLVPAPHLHLLVLFFRRSTGCCWCRRCPCVSLCCCDHLHLPRLLLQLQLQDTLASGLLRADRSQKDNDDTVMRACRIIDCLWSDPVSPEEGEGEKTESVKSSRGCNTVR